MIDFRMQMYGLE